MFPQAQLHVEVNANACVFCSPNVDWANCFSFFSGTLLICSLLYASLGAPWIKEGRNALPSHKNPQGTHSSNLVLSKPESVKSQEFESGKVTSYSGSHHLSHLSVRVFQSDAETLLAVMQPHHPHHSVMSPCPLKNLHHCVTLSQKHGLPYAPSLTLH